jgi:hypothetical protein
MERAILTKAARIVPISWLFAALLFSLGMAWNTAGWPVSLAEAMVFAFTGITALRALFVRRVYFPWTASVLFAACAWIAAQLCAAQPVYRFGTFQSLLMFLSIAGAFWSTPQLMESQAASLAFRLGLIAIGSATAAFSILYLLTSNGRVYWVIDTLDSWRPMGPFLNANHNAVFMELLLPLALWEALHTAHRRYVYGAASVLMYSSVIFSASRAGMILATLEIAALLLHSLVQARFSRRMILAGCGLLASIAGGAFLSDWQTVLRRFQTNDMFQQRRELSQSTALMIREHPWKGSGLGTWAIEYPRFAVFEPGLAVYHAHNDWAEWTAEGGIPFALLLGAGVLGSMLRIRRFPWGAGVAAAAAHAFVDFPFHVYADLLCFYVIAGLMESAARNRQSARQPHATIVRGVTPRAQVLALPPQHPAAHARKEWSCE